jgi:molybdopterin synthase sulfur carrier subunit
MSSNITVEFLGPINKEPINIEASSLQEVKQILKDDSLLSSWLQSSAVALNDEIVNNLNIQLKDGDKISLLPPVCGG